MSNRPYLTGGTVAFPTLDDSELTVLETLGTRRSVTVGEYLYREGDATYNFYVILSGATEIVVRSEGEERIFDELRTYLRSRRAMGEVISLREQRQASLQRLAALQTAIQAAS